MAQYTTGTVDAASGSNIVTGVDTLWLSNVQAGDQIFIADDVVPFEIASVDSDTQLTLAANYHSDRDDETYTIVSDFTTNLALPLLNKGDQHGHDIFSRAMRQLDTKMVAMNADELFNLDGGNSVTGFLFTRSSGGLPRIVFYIDGEIVGEFEALS